MNTELTQEQLTAHVRHQLASGRKSYGALLQGIGGYHGPNYRPLDRCLQAMRKRGDIRVGRATKSEKSGWELTLSPASFNNITFPVGRTVDKPACSHCYSRDRAEGSALCAVCFEAEVRSAK